MQRTPANGASRPLVSTDILVVGGGIAGQAVLEEIRRRDTDVGLALACAEPHLPYDRVSLGKLLDDRAALDELRLRPDEWYREHRVATLVGRKVVALDPDSGLAELDDGQRIAFERAVLCTGSDPLVPPIPGVALDGVHVFRSPEDCARIRAQARAGVRVCVIGGGLLGLEAARGLVDRGCEVTVVHLMDRLMERQLDPAAAELLAARIEELGVRVLLSHETTAIERDVAQGLRLRFADGSSLPCDMCVISIGIRPQTELARAVGLECERGVVVDDRLVTSHERVLAVGECAEHRGVVYGTVAPIHEQARVVATTLCAPDAGVAYAGSIPSTRLKVIGVDLVCIGQPQAERAVAVADAELRVYRKLCVDEGRAVGAILLGDTRGHELLQDAIRGGRGVDDPLALLAEASKASAADLPDSAQICNCNGVCKAEILAAIRERGLGSTQEVVAVTRAGAGCGSCKPLVSELLALERGGVPEEPTYLCPCKRQTREQLAALCREREITSVGALAAACGAGSECGACKPGLAYLVSEVNDNRHREERHARFVNDRVHANIQRDGTFSVVPRMRGGVTTPEELRRIADVAEKYQVPLVKLTGGQRIDLLGVRKEQLPAIWEDLGMPSGHAYAKAVRTVKTCVGSDFCRFGLGDSIRLGIELEREMEGLYCPHKVKSAVSGCPRNCAEAYVKDIGIVAVEGGWEIYVGGAAGSRVRKGDLLARVESPEQAKRLAVTFLQYYRENAEYLERTYDFVERVGIDTVKRAVLDAEEGARLRERFAIAKAACDPDPWQERKRPVHPKQFAELDTEPERPRLAVAAGGPDEKGDGEGRVR